MSPSFPPFVGEVESEIAAQSEGSFGEEQGNWADDQARADNKAPPENAIRGG